MIITIINLDILEPLEYIGIQRGFNNKAIVEKEKCRIEINLSDRLNFERNILTKHIWRNEVNIY